MQLENNPQSKQEPIMVPDEVIVPDSALVVLDPYVVAEKNAYIRTASEGAGVPAPQGEAQEYDVQKLIDQAKSDEVAVRKAALSQLVTNMNIDAGLRAELGQQLATAFQMEMQGFDKFSEVERLMDNSHDEALLTRDGNYEKEIVRIEDRNGHGRSTAEIATRVRNKDEAIQATAAAAIGTKEGHQALRKVWDKVDAQYTFLSLKPTDVFNTVTELIPGSAIQPTAVVVQILQKSGIKSLNKFWEGKTSGLEGVKSSVSAGFVMDDLSKEIAKLPPQDQIKLANTITAYMNEPGWKTAVGGRALALQNAVEILVRNIPQENPEEVSKMLSSVVNFVGKENVETTANVLYSMAHVWDVVPFAAGGTRMLKQSSRMLKTAARVAPVSRPAVASEIAGILKTAPEIVKEGGNELLAAGLPKSSVAFDRANISVDLHKKLEDIDAVVGRVESQLMRVVQRPISPVSKDAPEAVRKFIEKQGMHGSPSASSIELTPEGDAFAITGRFGASANEGFESLAKAQAAVKKIGVIPENEVQYAIRDKNSGVIYTPKDGQNYEAAKALAETPNGSKVLEWYVQTDYKVDANRLLYKDGITDSVVDDMGVGWFRRAVFENQYLEKIGLSLRNAYSTLNGRITANLKQAAGFGYNTQAMFKEVYSRASNQIPDREWVAVNKAMRATQDNGGILTMPQLRALGVESDGAIAGYYGLQRSLEMSWKFANRGLARTMASDGWERITGPRGGLLAYGKRLESAPELKRGEGVYLVNELGEKSTATMSAVEMAAKLEEGYVLYRNQAVDWDGRIEVPYTMLNPNNSKVSTRAVLETDEVLDKVPGYVPESLSDNFVVYGETKSGRKYIVASSKSMSAAEDFIAEQMPNGVFKVGSEFSDKYERLVAQPFGGYHSYSGKAQQDIYENLNGLVYGKKGESIVSLDGPAGSNYVDPIDAVYKTFAILSDNYTKGSYTQFLENSLIEQLRMVPGILKDGARQRVFTEGAVGLDDFVTSPPPGLRGHWESAISTLKTLDAYKLMPDADVALASRAFEFISLKMTKFPAIQSIMQAAARKGISPTSFIKKLRYNTVIRFNPVPHYQMNAMQAAINAGWPVSSTQAMILHGAFQEAMFARLDWMTGVISEAAYKAKVKQVSRFAGLKGAGLSYDELLDLADSYVTQGLYDQVRHNSIMRRSAITDAELEGQARVSRGVVGKVKSTMIGITDALDSVGAPAGEHFASQFTYLAQYFATRGKARNTLRTSQGRADLMARTMDFLGNMTPEGQLALQKGVWSAALQFMAFGLKMQFILTPFLQPRSLSALDSARMMIGAIPMYGFRVADSASFVYKTYLDSYMNDPTNAEQRYDWSGSLAEMLTETGLLSVSVDNFVKNLAILANPELSQEQYGFIDFDKSRLGVGAGWQGITQTVVETADGIVDAFIDLATGNPMDAMAKLFAAGSGLNGSVFTVAARQAMLYKDSSENMTDEDYLRMLAPSVQQMAEKMLPMLNSYTRAMILKNHGELFDKSFQPTGERGSNNLYNLYYLLQGAQTKGDASVFEQQKLGDKVKSQMDDEDAEARDTAKAIVQHIYANVVIEGAPEHIVLKAMEQHHQVMRFLYGGMEPHYAQKVERLVNDMLIADRANQTKEGKRVEAIIGEVSEARLNQKGADKLDELYNSRLGDRDLKAAREFSNYFRKQEGE